MDTLGDSSVGPSQVLCLCCCQLNAGQIVIFLQRRHPNLALGNHVGFLILQEATGHVVTFAKSVVRFLGYSELPQSNYS